MNLADLWDRIDSKEPALVEQYFSLYSAGNKEIAEANYNAAVRKLNSAKTRSTIVGICSIPFCFLLVGFIMIGWVVYWKMGLGRMRSALDQGYAAWKAKQA